MFKNRKVKLLKLFYILFFISCSKTEEIKDTDYEIKNEEKTKISLKCNQDTDSIYIVNDTLIIRCDGVQKEYEGLIKNAMSLTTSLKVLGNNTFYLNYEYNASSTKVQQLYKYIVANGDLFLVFKETIKLNKDKSGSSRVYLKDIKIKNQDYDYLETIGEVEVDYSPINHSAKTSLFNHNKQKFAEITYVKSSIDRFIDFPLLSKEYSLIKYIVFYNILEANNIAYYLEQAEAYGEAVFLLEKIIEKFPDRAVAYINLGDAHWGLRNHKKANEAYAVYIKMMQDSGKAHKIPQRVFERREQVVH